MRQIINRLLHRKQKRTEPKQCFQLVKDKKGLYPIGQQFKKKTNFNMSIGFGPCLEEAIANLPEGGKIEIVIRGVEA